MNLPAKFRSLHTDQLFRTWLESGRPPVVRIVPREPLGAPTECGGGAVDATVTVVTIRCMNIDGQARFEPFDATDLAAINEWESRHRETTKEQFDWFPALGEAQ